MVWLLCLFYALSFRVAARRKKSLMSGLIPYGDIRLIIEQSGITDGAKQLANSMFHKVAAAETTVHGRPIDEVHFHEVGALDSIVDIISVAILMDYIQPNHVISSVVSDAH